MSRVTLAFFFSLIALAVAARDIANDPPPKRADPLATPEGRFAHSIKIPNPVPADSGYRPGMTSKQYFDHLCRTEAGEFIFKAVGNVAGLMILRSRPLATDDMLMDRYALEDPFGDGTWEATDPARILVGSYGYRYVEIPRTETNQTMYERHFGYFSRWEGRVLKEAPMKTEVSPRRLSRYGFTWRGVKRLNDRDLGIAGGELIVFDLTTEEILAIRRGYVRSGDVKNSRTGVWWLGGHVCPQAPKKLFSTAEFLVKVLKPNSANVREGHK
jgi:hypothetical protein